MNAYLDTAAFVKLYHREDGTDNLVGFLAAHADDLVLTVSDLAFIEFRSSILRRVRMREIEVASAEQLFRESNRDTAWLNVVQLDRAVAAGAMSLLERHGPIKHFRTLDSLQLSSAVVADTDFPIDVFVSADDRLLSVAAEYFEVYNPLRLQ